MGSKALVCYVYVFRHTLSNIINKGYFFLYNLYRFNQTARLKWCCLTLQVVFTSPYEHHSNILPWREIHAEVSFVRTFSPRKHPPWGTLDAEIKAHSSISSTLYWLLVLYHQTSKLLLSNPTSLDQNVLKNYRPISDLPFLSKILEKVFLHKFHAHLQENNVCNPFQSACHTGHSTESTLLRVINDLLNSVDEDKISVLLLRDLSAAFDTIDHQILLSSLETAFGIRSTAL